MENSKLEPIIENASNFEDFCRKYKCSKCDLLTYKLEDAPDKIIGCKEKFELAQKQLKHRREFRVFSSFKEYFLFNRHNLFSTENIEKNHEMTWETAIRSMKNQIKE